MKRREMTRMEMMREIRECWREVPEGSYIEKVYEAVFDVLKQEPCEDAISRQAVLEIVEREQNKGDALQEIEKLPSVNPQQKAGKWITWKEAGNQIP